MQTHVQSLSCKVLCESCSVWAAAGSLAEGLSPDEVTGEAEDAAGLQLETSFHGCLARL